MKKRIQHYLLATLIYFNASLTLGFIMTLNFKMEFVDFMITSTILGLYYLWYLGYNNIHPLRITK